MRQEIPTPVYKKADTNCAAAAVAHLRTETEKVCFSASLIFCTPKPNHDALLTFISLQTEEKWRGFFTLLLLRRLLFAFLCVRRMMTISAAVSLSFSSSFGGGGGSSNYRY